MTDEALIARLRELDGWVMHGARTHLAAAARIEELAERNKELTLQLLATHGQAADSVDKLAKAVEALDRLVALDDDYSPFGGELLRDRVERTWQNARTTLAELKGESHE